MGGTVPNWRGATNTFLSTQFEHQAAQRTAPIATKLTMGSWEIINKATGRCCHPSLTLRVSMPPSVVARSILTRSVSEGGMLSSAARLISWHVPPAFAWGDRVRPGYRPQALRVYLRAHNLGSEFHVLCNRFSSLRQHAPVHVLPRAE